MGERRGACTLESSRVLAVAVTGRGLLLALCHRGLDAPPGQGNRAEHRDPGAVAGVLDLLSHGAAAAARPSARTSPSTGSTAGTCSRPPDPRRERDPSPSSSTCTAWPRGRRCRPTRASSAPRPRPTGSSSCSPKAPGHPVSWDIAPSTSGAPQPRHRLHERHARRRRSTAQCVDGRGSTPPGSPTARCSPRCWPAPWPTASPRSPPWPAS